MTPHVDPTDIYGQDLVLVFGPKANRRHISTLTAAEKRAIITSVPEYVSTEDLGPRPSIFQVVNKILFILQQTKALEGLDFDWCTDLRAGQLIRHDSMYVDVGICYKNNKVQRGIWLQHLLEDILFCFNPTNVLSGLARKLKDGTLNLNNGQHRTITCVIVGIRQIPVEYIASDMESVDVDEYATDNLNTLASSEYDNHRVRVWRIKVRREEGRTDLELDDAKHESLHDLHASKGSRFVEKGTVNTKPLECTGVGNMVKYYDQYGHDVYAKALDVVCSAWSKSALSTANCWGLMEFISAQETANGPLDQMFIWKLQNALCTRWSDPARSSMHNDIKRVVSSNPDFAELKLPEPKVIAAGIFKVVKNAHPDLALAPIVHSVKGKDGAVMKRDMTETYMGNLRIMPQRKAA